MGVQRQGPAGDQPVVVAEAVEPDGRPVVLDASDRGGAVGERGDVVAVSGEEVARVHAEAARGQVGGGGRSMAGRRVDAPVVAGDRAGARDVPREVGGEQGSQRGITVPPA